MILPQVPPRPGTLPGLTQPVGPLTGVMPLPISQGYCPPGYLPQYCGLQNGVSPYDVSPYAGWGGQCTPATPIYQCIGQGRTMAAFGSMGCMVGDYSCAIQQQNMTAMGCPPGPMQGGCVQQMYMRQQYYQQPQQQQQNFVRGVAAGAVVGAMVVSQLSHGMGGAGGSFGASRERSEIADGGYDTGPTFRGTGTSSRAKWITAEQLDDPTNEFPVVRKLRIWIPKCFEKLGWQSCQFQNEGTMGDANHDVSCHNNGNAMDIGKIRCADPVGEVDPPNDPRYMDMAKCMAAQTDNNFGVIYRDQRAAPNMMVGKNPGDHDKHMHIEIRGCRPVRHGG